MITVKEIVQIAESGDTRIQAFRIDKDQKDYPIDPLQVAYFIAEGKQTVKIEGLEYYISNLYSKTVHCFISPKNAPSFDEHTDLCDLTIYCVSGKKTIELQGREYTILEGDSLLIPEGTLHKATNKYDSVMLSIGY